MKHSLKLRSETNMRSTFLPVEKISFCTSNVKEAIGNNMDAIAALSVTGAFKVLPASASVEDLNEAVGFPFDWDISDEDLAKQQAAMLEVTNSGKLAYHYETVVHRYFEETGGVARKGAATANRGRYATSARAGIV